MRRRGLAARASAVGQSARRAAAAYMTVALGMALLLLPAVAEACPACAGRDESGAGLLVLLGAMILFPSVIFSVVLVVLRRSAHEL